MDTETPISLYQKLALAEDYSYLLESVKDGRYSFIGISPEKVFEEYRNGLLIHEEDGSRYYPGKDLLNELKGYLKSYRVKDFDDLPPFSGGFVGFLAYEMVEKWASIGHKGDNEDEYDKKPLGVFVLSRLLIAYDHLHNTVKIINNIPVDDYLGIEEKEELYYRGAAKIREILNKIRKEARIPVTEKDESPYGQEPDTGEEITARISKEEFCSMVKKAKDYIETGEVAQLVLSQKFLLRNNISAFQLFRALRAINPSPYLYYLNFPESKLIGSSPEILVKVMRNRVIVRPLAGTRPRGETRERDLQLMQELKNDLKECIEHIMLVDLGYDELERICRIGSVEVTELMEVEYYSQVMHLVSQIEGELKKGLDSLDVLKSVFPAGTVSGFPKTRALELVKELEREDRGPYAGAVGYLAFNGNLDTCITIRTFVVEEEEIVIQAGAGIVADSVPEKEYEETMNKARALFKAVKLARKGIDRADVKAL